jgi:nicotinamidase-related amidase
MSIIAESVTDPTTTDRKLGLRAGDALIVVDVQRDFLPGGSLAVAAGNQVISRLNAYTAAFEARHLPIFLTRDWHPKNHCSFRSEGGHWPAHGVQGTPGADWPDELTVSPSSHVISKGMRKDVEAYSAFSGTALLQSLHDLQVRRVFVGGLATDYCVRDTVMDARLHGFEVVVLADAVCGVNAAPGDETRAIREMIESGATLLRGAPPHHRCHSAVAW